MPLFWCETKDWWYVDRNFQKKFQYNDVSLLYDGVISECNCTCYGAKSNLYIVGDWK